MSAYGFLVSEIRPRRVQVHIAAFLMHLFCAFGYENPFMARSHKEKSSSWDPVASWYIGWVGKKGSKHHRRLAIPTVMDLLQPEAGEQVLDVGCGPGVLAPHVARTGAVYTGVDASPRLITFARKHHGAHGIFLLGDATQLERVPALQPSSFDAAVFLLSIQDINPLDAALASAAWALRSGGRLVVLMTHPCFRVPWHSGWDWDADRRLRYRRVERYRTPFAAPMQDYSGPRRGSTRSYHRPLETYVNALAAHGLLVDRLDEIPSYEFDGTRARRKAAARANDEIPLFLGLRAVMR